MKTINFEFLQNKALSLAITGKLCSYDGNDCVENLLKLLNDEKKKLIIDGFIDDDSKIISLVNIDNPNIQYIKSDNLDIPEKWGFLCIDDLFEISTGLNYKKENLEVASNDMIRIIRGGNIINNKLVFNFDDLYISSQFIKNNIYLYEDCIITPAVSSLEQIGKTALIKNINEKCVPGGFVYLLKPKFKNKTMIEYIYYVFLSQYHINNCKQNVKKSGSAFYNLNKNMFKNFLLPIPPLEEMKEIIKILRELFSNLEDLQISNYNLKKYGENLKNKILDLAFLGKLTKQDYSKSGNSILDEILQKRDDLINKKIYRKDNVIKEITDEDLSNWSVPTNWTITRIGNLGFYKKGPFGSSLTKDMFVKKGTDTIKVYEQKNAIQKRSDIGNYYITEDYFLAKMKGFEVFPNDIIVSCAGTIGETYIMPSDIERGIINQALMKMTILEPFNKDYFLLYFDHVLKKESSNGGKGSAIKNIPPFEVFKNYIIPVPPIEEQKQIVDKINDLFDLIDSF